MTPLSASFPSFAKHPDTPPLKPGPLGGIAIAGPPIVYLGDSTALALHGILLVPKSEMETFAGHLLEAAVVLLRNPCPRTRSVSDGLLTFEDDLFDEGEMVRGYFNLDLFVHFGLEREPGRLWVCASVFGHVSPVLTMRMEPGRTPGS